MFPFTFATSDVIITLQGLHQRRGGQTEDYLHHDNVSLRSSYNEESVVKSPDANDYFGKWDSRTPSPKTPTRDMTSTNVIHQQQQQQQAYDPEAYDGMRRDNWYRDDWVNRQDQWRGQYPGYHDQGRPAVLPPRQMRTPSPERSQPWDPAIGYPHTVDTGYYQATAPSAPPLHPEERQRAPGIGAVFGNRSLDRSTLFGTGMTRGLNSYLSETGRNLSQPSLAINRLVGAATGRRLPQPPPEVQKPLAMPLPNTPLPMTQKPVALSFRNRKLPQVPANAHTGVGGGPTLTSTMTTSVNKTPRPSVVRSSRSFHLPFASAFQSNQPPQAATNQNLNRSSRGAKLPVVPGSQPVQQPGSALGGFWGSITGRRKLPDRGATQSRSLDYPGGPTLETVVEAGRGVRKLPLHPTGSLGRGRQSTNLWQNGTTNNMMNGTNNMMNGTNNMMNGNVNGGPAVPMMNGAAPINQMQPPMDMPMDMMQPQPQQPQPQMGPMMGMTQQPMQCPPQPQPQQMCPQPMQPQPQMANGMLQMAPQPNGYLPPEADPFGQQPQQPEWT